MFLFHKKILKLIRRLRMILRYKYIYNKIKKFLYKIANESQKLCVIFVNENFLFNFQSRVILFLKKIISLNFIILVKT